VKKCLKKPQAAGDFFLTLYINIFKCTNENNCVFNRFSPHVMKQLRIWLWKKYDVNAQYHQNAI